MLTGWEILFSGTVFSIAAVLHGICGFGFSLISVSVLSLVLGPKLAVPLDLIVATANCFYLAWVLRDHIIWKETFTLIIFSLLFVPLGTLYLRHINPAIVVRTLGLVVICVSLLAIFRKRKLSIFSSRYFKWIAGSLSGLLGGAFNIPGPPLVLYSYNSHWPVRNAKANLQLIFSVMTLMIIISFYKAQLLSTDILLAGIGFMPFVIFFTFLGAFIAKKMAVNILTMAINIMLFVLGLFLLIKG